MTERPSKRHMLIPKGAFRPFIPVLPEAELNRLLDPLSMTKPQG